MKYDTIFCSFYTADDYYREQGEGLRQNLEGLGIEHVIREVDIPEGKDWADICRTKIEFLHDVYFAHPGKRVFWIDADCRLLSFPDSIAHTSADLVGFQRGFSSPMRIGYAYRTRFWEPCLLGINATPGGERFIEDALIAEKRFDGKATDDYFFEESWRLNASHLHYQIIPSTLVAKNASSVNSRSVFVFGSSGNVAEFKGKVSQHRSTSKGVVSQTSGPFKAQAKARLKALVPARYHPMLKSLRTNLRAKSVKGVVAELDTRQFGIRCFEAGSRGDAQAVARLAASYDELKSAGKGSQVRGHAVTRAQAFLAYRRDDLDPALPLSWWSHPAPGNFGDWLSPYVFGRIGECGVRYAPPEKSDQGSRVLGIGSIAKFADAQATVIGSGVSRRQAGLNPKARYLLLRGPYSAEEVSAASGHFEGAFGDPGLLMPLLHQPKPQPRRARIGLVRHFSHLRVPLLFGDDVEEFDVRVSLPSGIEAFIDRLHQYEVIITSAMHVAIMCVAYGIPHRLVTFNGLEDAVSGDGIKYRDFYAGAGLVERNPLAVRRNLTALDLHSLAVEDALSQERLETLHQAFKEALETYRAGVAR